MLMGAFCHCVKSATNCTLVAVGAVNENVCAFPFPVPAFPLFALFFFAICLVLFWLRAAPFDPIIHID
jgi:hypothetical protein